MNRLLLPTETNLVMKVMFLTICDNFDFSIALLFFDVRIEFSVLVTDKDCSVHIYK